MTPASPGRLPRVATVITGLGMGGAETSMLRIIEATGRDFTHLVLSLRSGDPLSAAVLGSGIELRELGMSGWLPSARRLMTARRWLAEFRPDVIVAHMYHAAIAATVLRRLATPGSGLVWVLHHSLGALPEERRSTQAAVRIGRALSASPSTIVYVSRRSAADHAAYGYPASRALIIPNGIDPELFRPDRRARQRLRTEFGFGVEDVVVGHVARVHPMKDHTTLLAALQIAHDQNPRVAALLCGPGTATLAAPAWVRRLGPRSDVNDVMNACDVGILSSAYGEAFPNVLAEFMACAVPCVTTDIGDAAEIVGELGRVVPAREPSALAAAILEYSAMSFTQRSKTGKSARASITDRFSIDAIAARHAALWRGAMADRGQ